MVKQRHLKDEELIKSMVKLSMNIKDEDLKNENVRKTFDQLVAKRNIEIAKERKISNNNLAGLKTSISSVLTNKNNEEAKEKEDEE